MEPEEALHWHILRRKKEGVEDWIDKSVEKIGAVPTLNTVLLPAMKEVGDKFGAGELILPFVLQSAEVMKRAVAQLENYLEQMEGHTKGKVVIATVFGDVHDIGKSLVNTILTNNGYTVVDLGKQVPVDTIINAAVEHDADAIGLSALLVSTSKQMPICVQELHAAGSSSPCWWAARRSTATSAAASSTRAARSPTRSTSPASSTARTPSRASTRWTRWSTARPVTRWSRRSRTQAHELREKPRGEDDSPPVTDDSVRSKARTDSPIPEPPFWGVREIDVDLDEVYPYLDRHVLFKLHWGGRGKKGEEWRQIVEGNGERGLRAQARAHVDASRTTCDPRAQVGYFPCNADGNELVVFDPEDHDKEIERLMFPRQPKHDRICLADFYRPIDSGERDVVALQGVTVGPEVTELLEQLEKEGEFSEQLFTHGLAVQSAEGLAEWLHAQARKELGIDPDQGRRYSWGYPGLPGPVRAREGLAAAGPRADRHVPLRRLRGDARAVDGGDRGPPPAGRLLRHEVGLHPQGEGARRADRRHRPRRRAAAGQGPARRTARSRPRAGARGGRSARVARP